MLSGNQTLSRLGAGLAAMAVLALMVMIGTYGSSPRASAGPPVRDPDYKVLATVDSVLFKAGDQSTAVLEVTKVQTIIVGDLVYWKGERWIVMARSEATVDLAADLCDSHIRPKDEDFVYGVANETCDNQGNGTADVSGVSDILIGNLNLGVSLFYCIAKTDHHNDDSLTSYLQCNIDIEGGGVAPPPPNLSPFPPTWGAACEQLSLRIPPECDWTATLNHQLNNASETGADGLLGPPPPPPYESLAPAVGVGMFYAAGVNDAACGFGNDCTVITSCFADIGSMVGMGPNIISRSIIRNPHGGANGGTTIAGVDRVSKGNVDIWFNQSNANCAALTPLGTLPYDQAPLFAMQVNDKNGTNVNPNPASWRADTTGRPGATALDFDGDGCTDEQELDPKAVGKCGDDPQNPSDSATLGDDLSGIYEILITVARGDCDSLADSPALQGQECESDYPGLYFFCRADLQHDATDNSVVVRPYCYSDSPADTGDPDFDPVFEINPEAYPGTTGDGLAGAPPPGPQYPAESLSFAYGDVDEKHAELTGTFNKTTNNFEIVGCIEDLDGVSSLGDVYIELMLSAHQLPGTVDIWIGQADNCAGSPLLGTPPDLDGTPTFADALITSWQPNPAKAKGYDQDDDGVPTERELMDDSVCGRRDPYNKNDYYDVSIPRDGVIDLPNDILGVILHFAPFGYPPGDENWDRPSTMAGAGAGGHWNRGSPDGVIDLPNDILGVILQFNPFGCPALS